MNHQLSIPLINSVHEVLSMMTQTQCETIQNSDNTSEDLGDQVIAAITITGDIDAKVDLIFPQSTGQALVEKMTGQADLSPQSIDDALGELCNMIVGSAKSSLSLDNAAISCPEISRMKNKDEQGVADAEKNLTIATQFNSEAGPFTMVLTAAA